MSRLIKIGSRKSDLARLQAKLVGQALAAKGFAVEYVFREAPADVNLSNPLWQMPTVGVFTSFLHDYLLRGEVDVIVHSWKDLPIEKNQGTRVVATLPREDPRDLFLLKKNRRPEKDILVLTSSPRRQHNLEEFLGKIIPRNLSHTLPVRFLDVRGNIQTRMGKLCHPSKLQLDATGRSADALIVAKAAVDRFLSTDDPEFLETRAVVKRTLESCDWAVLPLSINPTAAAQGALALEVAEDNKAVSEIISSLNCPATFQACEEERRILKSLGGGCHQKIGCTVLPRKYGNVYSLRGLSDKGYSIDAYQIGEPEIPAEALIQAPEPRKVEPRKPVVHKAVGGKHGLPIFDRQPLNDPLPKLENFNLLVTKSEAAPVDLAERISSENVVWAAGVDSWTKLAEQGVWVNGCSDRLGEAEDANIALLARNLPWLKLTHQDAPEEGHVKKIATYRLIPKADSKESLRNWLTSDVTHVYWASSSCFEHACEVIPEIVDRLVHGCGPGHTFEAVKKRVPTNKIIVAFGYHEFVNKASR